VPILLRGTVIVILVLMGCQGPDQMPSRKEADAPQSGTARLVAPQPLPLAPPLNQPEVELSGLTWYDDTLIVLPQYPTRGTGTHDGGVYGIPRSTLVQAVADSTLAPIEPIHFPFTAKDVETHLPDHQGFEAIAFVGARVYVVTEGVSAPSGMRGTLLWGDIVSDRAMIQVRGVTARRLPQQANLPNISYEALTTRGDTVIALFEANGANVNPDPHAYTFVDGAGPLSPLPFPTLEYRLTDATPDDSLGRFWVMNYFFPGDYDLLEPAGPSASAPANSTGPPSDTTAVERLVEYRWTPTGIHRTATPPIQFVLGEAPRNWEGVARLGEGFLVVTDTFPSTILAYVPGPSSTRK